MKRRHRSASPYETKFGFCRGVRYGDRILVSGTAPIGPDGKTVEGDAKAQAQRCFQVAAEAIDALGGEMTDVIRTRMYLVDRADSDRVGEAHGEVFRGIDPAATMVVVAGLLDPAWKVEIEVEAQLDVIRI